MAELSDEASLNQSGIRKPGGGRKQSSDTISGLGQAFHDILKDNTAGDPMNDKVKWTSLSRSEIAEKLKKKDSL